MSIATLLKRALPGSKSSLAGHIERGERIAQAIQQRFGISEPYQWQVKHLRWVMERWTSNMSAATRYDYWRTTRAMASVMNHWPDWSPHLLGPWCKPGIGGRPPKLAQPRNRSSRP